MADGGKEGKRREELRLAQRAYKQQVAKEERMKRRIAEAEVAHNASMRALTEAKIYIGKMPPLGKEKGHMDPQSATVSLINRATRAIKKARDS